MGTPLKRRKSSKTRHSTAKAMAEFDLAVALARAKASIALEQARTNIALSVEKLTPTAYELATKGKGRLLATLAAITRRTKR